MLHNLCGEKLAIQVGLNGIGYKNRLFSCAEHIGAQPEMFVEFQMCIRDRFYHEGFSLQCAADVVEKVWNIAADSGYSNHFKSVQFGAATDDHVFIIRAGIPLSLIHISNAEHANENG